MHAEGRGRGPPRVLGQQVGQGGGLGLGERRIGVFPIASGVVDWNGGLGGECGELGSVGLSTQAELRL